MATNFGGVHVGCHCWVPLLGAIVGCHGWMPLLGAIAGCHCWRLATNFGGVHVGCHCWVPLRDKIDQSVTPFSAAPFSTLITHKLACVYAGVISFSFFLRQLRQTQNMATCQNVPKMEVEVKQTICYLGHYHHISSNSSK